MLSHQEEPSYRRATSTARVDEAGMILVVNKLARMLLRAARHVFGCASLGLFSSIDIRVVNHGYSKIASKIT